MIKKIVSAFLIIASISATAQESAIIDMKITNTKGASGTIKIYYSDLGARSKIKMNMPAGAPMPVGGINIDALTKSNEPNKHYMINETNKTFSVTDAAKETKHQPENTKITVEKIGSEKVNGYNCVHAKIFSNGKQMSETWNSKEVFNDFDKYSNIFKSANRRGAIDGDAENKALKDAGCDGFPIKTISEGHEEGTTIIELVKFEKTQVDKNLFVVPADYKQAGMANTIMGMDMDMDKIMKMSPEEREAWQKQMIQKMGGQH